MTPWQGSEQGEEGGLPTKEGRQEQEKEPGVLTHTALAPHTRGSERHSSTSRQRVPAAVKPCLQTHWPAWHSALLVQSKLVLHRVLTSVASHAMLPLPVNPGGHSHLYPGLVFRHTALAAKYSSYQSIWGFRCSNKIQLFKLSTSTRVCLSGALISITACHKWISC